MTISRTIRARSEAARCLEMAGRARRRVTLDLVRRAAPRQRRGACLSAREWLREARHWSGLAGTLP